MPIGGIREDDEVARAGVVGNGHASGILRAHVNGVVIPDGRDAVLNREVTLRQLHTLIPVSVCAVAIAAVACALVAAVGVSGHAIERGHDGAARLGGRAGCAGLDEEKAFFEGGGVGGGGNDREGEGEEEEEGERERGSHLRERER